MNDLHGFIKTLLSFYLHKNANKINKIFNIWGLTHLVGRITNEFDLVCLA